MSILIIDTSSPSLKYHLIKDPIVATLAVPSEKSLSVCRRIGDEHTNHKYITPFSKVSSQNHPRGQLSKEAQSNQATLIIQLIAPLLLPM